MTEFERRVAAVLSTVGTGDVMAYGEVGQEAGFPGCGRAVGGFLARHGDQFPWWRIVMADGRLAPGKEDDQSRRLRAEGVKVENGRVRRG